MKKYYHIDKKPGEIPDKWDGTYKVAVVGKSLLDPFLRWWAANPTIQKGIIFQIYLTPTCNIFENASAFLYMLQTLTRPQWDNGIPPMVDFFDSPIGNQPTLDNMQTFRQRIRESYDMRGKKMLLRMGGDVWRSWCAKNPGITQGLLDVFDILLSQPGAVKPDELQFVGSPQWWEPEAWGVFWNDPSGEWETETPPPPPPGGGGGTPATGSYCVKFNGVIIPGLTIEPL